MAQTFVNRFKNLLEPPVRQHLKNVYGALTLTCVSASAGVYVHYALFQAEILSAIAGISLMFLLLVTPDRYGKNTKKRLGYLLGFGLTSGMGLGPLLAKVNSINPAIIVTALLSTTLVFVCFSIAAMLAERGSCLLLGGTLGTLMISIFITKIMNIFMQSHILYQMNLYLGLWMMCGFVLFDTQLMIEECRHGNKDFVKHAFELFINFIGIFRRLLVSLTQKEEQDRCSKPE